MSMAETSAIEWTDSTWNPVTGCTRVSPGCAHCYIETTMPFRTKGRKFERVGNEEKTDLQLHEDRLDPKKVPKGPRIFVNSLSDLFHEEIPTDFIFRALDVMADLPDRTFQVLTKRPEQAQAVLGLYYDRPAPRGHSTDPPLPNIWLGVSIENARYTWRADVLRELPAAVRFISAEPLLGSLFSVGADYESGGRVLHRDRVMNAGRSPLDLTGIDWLIVGGESGGKFARPMHPEWARELRNSCLGERGWSLPWPRRDLPAGETAFFFKQWGSHNENGAYVGAGPKSGGRLLDGREWNEMPAVPHLTQEAIF